MLHTEYRIILAAIAVFASLAGMGAAVHGLLFDEYNVTRYGVAVIVASVACFVMLLNPATGHEA
ncbi:DUF2964 family protein [Paraburkholderia sp. BCC1885]|uniref:DUF2964 family protein n=1 Tax=Paraburkholderia sp. BCC1885 TaxID=2562669 RepID=UPI001182855C|nr:DUF2964 family protein [Paraburkholderia sp. BCC1885]